MLLAKRASRLSVELHDGHDTVICHIHQGVPNGFIFNLGLSSSTERGQAVVLIVDARYGGDNAELLVCIGKRIAVVMVFALVHTVQFGANSAVPFNIRWQWFDCSFQIWLLRAPLLPARYPVPGLKYQNRIERNEAKGDDL